MVFTVLQMREYYDLKLPEQIFLLLQLAPKLNRAFTPALLARQN